MKSLSLTIQKIWVNVKVFANRETDKQKDGQAKILVPIEKSCHKEHTNGI
jgi:hypothetical protein